MVRDCQVDTVARMSGSGIPNDNPLQRPLRIGVIALPYMSNFTDFDVLAAEPSVALAFVEDAEDTILADVLILPGTKQTLDDLRWLEINGFRFQDTEST